ncbi:MAG: hypothetical protein NDJ75_10475 [Thermoanaerobaculia bacterium]|nr:hypothetical protein [Thermoanaerobaculia bacterium]
MSAPRTAGRSERLRLAVFVSPHGFGHAARAAALLAALHEQRPALAVTLYTTVPRWFFAESLSFSLSYRELACDVGLVQKSALEEDLPETVRRLDALWTETKGFHLEGLVSEVRDSGAAAVVCDISPLGLLVAREAGLPAILVESFTWDWIYEPLVADEPRLAPWVERMRELFALADLRIQAAPACVPRTPGPAVVHVPPIARAPRATPAAVRARLGVAPGRPLILVSMGGVGWRFADFDRLHAAGDLDFVVPGGAADGTRETRRGNVVLLPHHSPVYHPDLVAAADVVVGKLGYSTVAEAYAAGARVLYPPRAGFREHAVLAEFVDRHLPCAAIDREALDSGAWVERLPALLARERPAATPSLGAAAAAAVLAARWS